MKKSYTNWTEDEEGNFLIDNGLILEPIPTLRGFDYSHYLNIDWNENLNYAVKMFGNRNQEDFYVALLINAGHFNPGQEKSTTFQWIDALVVGTNVGFVTTAPTENPEGQYSNPLTSASESRAKATLRYKSSNC